jgi:hypothetical protein
MLNEQDFDTIIRDTIRDDMGCAGHNEFWRTVDVAWSSDERIIRKERCSP